MTVTRDTVENFLYDEAELLDQWKCQEWANLFTEDCEYLVPPTDEPEGDPKTTLFLVADDHHRLQQRAKRLMSKNAHAEYPHSRTRHMVSNVRIKSQDHNEIKVTANFAVYRSKRETVDVYMGEYRYTLVPDGNSFKIKSKRCNLDLESLRPHGKVSILL